MDERSGEATVRAIFDATIALHQARRDADHGPLLRAAEAIRQAHDAGRKTLIFGNGGSATDAQHFATELMCRLQRDREAISALALTTDTGLLTAIGNDYGFERVFARQVEGLGRAGDVAVGISTSGTSANVVNALEAARTRGMITIGLTGRDGGAVGRMVDIHVNVADDSAARVQEVHRTLIHALCELIER